MFRSPLKIKSCEVSLAALILIMGFLLQQTRPSTRTTSRPAAAAAALCAAKAKCVISIG